MEIINLNGRKGPVVGIANEHRLACAAAQHFRNAGADLAIAYLNGKAKPFVEPLAREAGASLTLPCDVAMPDQLEAVFEAIEKEWGRLDFLPHSIAWARKEDLHGRLETREVGARRSCWRATTQARLPGKPSTCTQDFTWRGWYFIDSGFYP